tara:strand:- start:147 stop:353 length:207 start_codon:yes stop_codon:yes gene_type:complete
MSISLIDYCFHYKIPYSLFNDLSNKESINLVTKIARTIDFLKLETYNPNYINVNLLKDEIKVKRKSSF